MFTSIPRVSLFAITCLVLACAPAPADDALDLAASDVVHGARDRGRHPAVVALVTEAGTLCSGALVAPRVVLTARHCVSRVTPEVACPSARDHILADLPPASIGVVTAEDARGAPVVARGARTVTFATRNLCGADVALLVLDRDVRGIAPLAVDTSALPDAVTVVGYGRRGDSSRAGVAARYTRDNVPVLEGTRAEFVTGEGPCNGDSGSPALDARTGRVVGVLSRGTDRCAGDSADAVWTRATVARALLDGAR
ncbi:MAG: trypsin-like serine protease [Polyangiales bacterium]